MKIENANGDTIIDSAKQYEDAGMNAQQTINLLNQELSSFKSQKEKFNIEFNRYKQDCRKKALEYGCETTMKVISNSQPEDVIESAAKYYLWLISIPG